MAQVSSITDATFVETISSPTPVLVDFWAEWCHPCRLTAPVLEQIAAELGDALRVVKLNVDENPAVPNALGIQGIPTLVLFKDGKAIDAVVGYMPKEKLLQRLRPHLAGSVAAR